VKWLKEDKILIEFKFKSWGKKQRLNEHIEGSSPIPLMQVGRVSGTMCITIVQTVWLHAIFHKYIRIAPSFPDIFDATNTVRVECWGLLLLAHPICIFVNYFLCVFCSICVDDITLLQNLVDCWRRLIMYVTVSDCISTVLYTTFTIASTCTRIWFWLTLM